MHLLLARACNTLGSVAGESGGHKKTNSKTKQCANTTKNPVRNTGELEGGWQPVLVGNHPMLVQIRRPVRRPFCLQSCRLFNPLSFLTSLVPLDRHQFFVGICYLYIQRWSDSNIPNYSLKRICFIHFRPEKGFSCQKLVYSSQLCLCNRPKYICKPSPCQFAITKAVQHPSNFVEVLFVLKDLHYLQILSLPFSYQ